MKSEEIYRTIDHLIERIDKYRIEPDFTEQLKLRNDKKVPNKLTENEIIEIFTTLIAL